MIKLDLNIAIQQRKNLKQTNTVIYAQFSALRTQPLKRGFFMPEFLLSVKPIIIRLLICFSVLRATVD